MRSLLVACASGLFGLCVAAQPLDRARLDAFFDALARHDLARGSLALAVPGQPLYTRAVGLASPRAGAATAETRYAIGSVSKVFTAAIVLQLVDEGKLALDAPLARFFPTFPNAERITVAMLLGHRSGLADIKDLRDFDEWVRQPRSFDDLRARLQAQPAKAEPGVRTDYNNSGYMLLWWIAERVTGLPYGELLQRRIAGPLGLAATGYSPQPQDDARIAAAFRWREDRGGWWPVPPTHPSVPGGAGAIVSTPSDLVRFAQALFDGRVVSAASLARMTTIVEGFGHGLMPLPRDPSAVGGREGFGHEGIIDGQQSVLMILPRERVALAYSSNGVRQERDAIVHAVLRTLYEPAFRPPSFAPVATTIDFAVELGPKDAAVTAVGLRGSAAPLSWQRTLPMARDGQSGLWRVRVPITLPDGAALEFKFVQGARDDAPLWERTPNRTLTASAATPQQQVVGRWNHDAALERLRAEVLAADARLFDALNRQDAETMAALFSPRLEFFHDQGGLADHAQTMRQFRQNFAAGVKVRRSLVPATTEVFSMGERGAMQFGAHDFCRRDGDRPDGAEQCQRLRFAVVWEKSAAGAWQMLRVLSYDH